MNENEWTYNGEPINNNKASQVTVSEERIRQGKTRRAIESYKDDMLFDSLAFDEIFGKDD